MPELPEVEAFTSYFNHTSTRQKIENVACKTASLLHKTTVSNLRSILKGNSFKPAHRKGKFLIAPLSKGTYKLVFHFGMTGSLEYAQQDNLSKQAQKYGQLIITFENGYALAWITKRKFAKVYLVKDIDEISTLKTMGPDAHTLSKNAFLTLLEERERKNIKSFLMDQDIIAGIGNEYSNEILYQANVAPMHSISSLDTSQPATIYTAMQSILKKAISLRIAGKGYPSTWLLAHVKYKGDKTCPKNKDHKLKRKKISGRSAWYCPHHQK